MELVQDQHKISYDYYKKNGFTTYKESHDMYLRGEANHIIFGTHQPVLIHMLNTVSEGSVLEFGMGPSSTPIISIICGEQNRYVVSVDNNPKWLEPLMFYQDEMHDIRLFEDEKIRNREYTFLNEKFTITLIDAHPAELRQVVIDFMRDLSDYIIVHDTEGVVNNIEYGYHYDFSKFKHVLHFTHTHPMTTVLSNLDEINPEILKLWQV